ncbi:DUF2141 domain-containing protein [Variovorax paradoxus]|uniref:DUF2141 domain-containing protein n=1 Tax=Variovorax paradoxus TaxID=34073 RepID=UPI0024785D08
MLAILPLVFLAVQSAWGAEIVVEVRGAFPPGQVRLALYGSPESFLRKPVATGHANLTDGVAVLSFSDLSPGRYAFSAYLDLNGNGKLDTNSMGIPIEPLAFSRNARGRMGPPAFEDAAFALEPSGAKIALELRK